VGVGGQAELEVGVDSVSGAPELVPPNCAGFRVAVVAPAGTSGSRRPARRRPACPEGRQGQRAGRVPGTRQLRTPLAAAQLSSAGYYAVVCLTGLRAAQQCYGLLINYDR
jgi:hypothetical protein